MAIAFTPSNPRLSFSAKGGWIFQFNLFNGLANAVPANLSGCTIAATLTLLGGSPFDFSSYCTIAGNAVNVDIPRSVTSTWPAGWEAGALSADYDISVRVLQTGLDADLYQIMSNGPLNRLLVYP